MSTVNIIPSSFADLRVKLMAIKNIAMRMTLQGYDVFQQDENWGYESEKDDNVCPVCTEFDYNDIMTGDKVGTEFTQKMWDDKPKRMRPHTHMDHTLGGEPLLGECRCRLYWVNFPMPIVDKLINEMRDAVA